jgi:ribosome biogenesis GTPase A
MAYFMAKAENFYKFGCLSAIMPSFWRHVNTVLKEADLIIQVLDARMIEETRNSELEEKVYASGKVLLYVVTKCDLVPRGTLDPIKRVLVPAVFISATEHHGTTILKKKILELSRGESVTVGVVGYPNVGKSSLINALAGRKVARTSSESGFTKGLQKIKVDNKIMLLDTPGVFPAGEKDTVKHGRTGAVDYARIKDPEMAALRLIEDEMEVVEGYYGVYGEEADDILIEIALKYKKLSKGGKPNLEVTARMVLRDWQKGKMHER